MPETRFRDDIDPSKTWVWSDTHFGHRNIADFANRPDGWTSLLVENCAQAVPDTEDSTLLHLGDLCYRGNAEFRALVAPHLRPKMGRKLLIRGNHDKQRASFYRRCGFKFARPFSIMWGGTEVSFSHYPWYDAEEGRPMPDNHVRVHGHIHTSGYTRSAYVPFLRNHINISCEQTNYSPVNLGLLLSAAIDGSYPTDGKPLPPAVDDVVKETQHVV